MVFATMPSLFEIWGSLVHDTVPLASTLALRFWIRLASDSDLALRLFGLGVHVSFLASLWASGRWLGSRAPLVALVLVGLNPEVVRSVVSLRPYGLGAVTLVLAFGLLWRAVQVPSRSSRLLAAAAAVASVQTLFTNAFPLAVVGVAAATVALQRSGWRAACAPLAIGAVAAVSLLPYLGPVLRGQEAHLVAQAEIGWAWYGQVARDVVGAGSDWLVWPWLALVVAVLVAAERAQGLTSRTDAQGLTSRASDPQRALALYAGMTIALAPPLFVVAMKLAVLPTQTWYYVPLLALVAVAIDAVVACLGRARLARAATGLLLCVIAVGLGLSARSALQQRQSNMDAVAAHLEAEVRSGDLIVVSPWFFGVSFQRYYTRSTPWTTIPPIADHRIHRYDLLRQRMLEGDSALDPLRRGIRRTLRSGGRVWVVGLLHRSPGGTPPAPLPPPPHPISGWQNGPYLHQWRGQVGDYLMAQGATGKPVPLELPPAREDPGLLVFQIPPMQPTGN